MGNEEVKSAVADAWPLIHLSGIREITFWRDRMLISL